MNSTRPRALSGSDSPEDRQLTKRENEVMRCLAKGRYDKEIAEELGISVWTVHFHLRSIYQKLLADNRIEAVNKWSERNYA